MSKKEIKKKNTKRKSVRKRASKKIQSLTDSVRRRRIIPIGGMGLANGIMMRSKDFISVAMQEGDDIELISFKIKQLRKFPKVLLLPFVRGVVFLVGNFFVVSKVLIHKRRFIKERIRKYPAHKRVHIRGSQYMLYLVYFILFIALFNYMDVVASGWPSTDLNFFIYNFLTIFLYFIFFVILFVMVSIANKSELDIFFYHGAEHKIINAYEKGKKLTLGNIKKESPFHPRCGSILVFYNIVILSVLLVFFSWKGFGVLLSLLVSFGFIALSFSVAFEFVRLATLKKDGLLFKIFIRPAYIFQALVVREPTDRQIEVGLLSFKEVLKLEKEK